MRSPCPLAAAVGTLALILLAGCNVGPKYTHPQVPSTPTFRGPDDATIASDPATSIADRKWSEVFHEPELQTLIATALANNFDLRVAAERVLEQQQQVRITRAQQFPSLNAGGTGLGADLGNSGALGNNISSPLAFGSFNFSAAWTPDFWGLYRKQTQQQRELLLAQEWAQRAVRLSLVQQVATTYFQLRALDAQLAIAQSTLKARQDSLKLTQTLEQGGAAPLSDVRQAEQLLYTATAQIPQIQQNIQQNENSMRLLLGQEPGPVAHTDPSALAPVPTDLPTGIPSQLLVRRPDIQQAEAQLRAANAAVGIARAQFFPQVSINASAGLGGNEFSNLFDPGGRTIYGYSTLAQPLFAGGRISGQYELSKRQKDELVLAYQRSILTAFRDVSNALIAVNKQRDARVGQQKLVAAAQDATRLARLRYQGGATGYLEVLTTDTNLFSAQLNLAGAQQSEALTLVTLYTALGGGWQ